MGTQQRQDWHYAFELIESGKETGSVFTMVALAGSKYSAAQRAYDHFVDAGVDFDKGDAVLRARVFVAEVELLHEAFEVRPHRDGLLRIIPL